MNANAYSIAYEGFNYTAGQSMRGQSGGMGFASGSRTMGSQGISSSGCENVACTCPETPFDALVTHGTSGATWTTGGNVASGSVRSAGLQYPGLATSGLSAKLTNNNARLFRTIDTSVPALISQVVSFNNAPSSAGRGTLGAPGSVIWMSFLAAMDCGGSYCVTDGNGVSGSQNAGIHLFDGIGNVDTDAQGPKHPFEHLQLGDRNLSNFWILARTMGSCANGSGTWDPTPHVLFDSNPHLIVVRMRFDVAAPGGTACSNGFSGSGACVCPAQTPNCLDEIAAWIDPDLSQLPGSMPATSSVTGVLAPTVVADFYFDTIEMNGEGESIDIDEIRVGTTYADVVPAGGSDGGSPPSDGSASSDVPNGGDASNGGGAGGAAGSFGGTSGAGGVGTSLGGMNGAGGATGSFGGTNGSGGAGSSLGGMNGAGGATASDAAAVVPDASSSAGGSTGHVDARPASGGSSGSAPGTSSEAGGCGCSTVGSRPNLVSLAIAIILGSLRGRRKRRANR